jgi:hypothetical protein
MSKKKWARCGCCIDWAYEFNEKAKGSQYRFGDDDDVPYKKPNRKKKKAKPHSWFSDCHHVYVWVKEIHPYRKWVPGKTPGFGKFVTTGEEYVRYMHRCIGCNLIKRHSWSYVPPEDQIYQTVRMDAYGYPL